MGNSMEMKDMPKWMNLIPIGLGVGLSILGMYGLPLVGIRNVFGPMIGLPLGTVIGFGMVHLWIKDK